MSSCCDDDDDDELDDELLSGAPTFGNKKKATTTSTTAAAFTRKENNMLNYLDECFESELVRSDRNKKIKDMVQKEKDDRRAAKKSASSANEDKSKEGEVGNGKENAANGIAAGGGGTNGGEKASASTEKTATSGTKARGKGKKRSNADASTKKEEKAESDESDDDGIDWERIRTESTVNATNSARSRRRRLLRDEMDGLHDLLPRDGEGDEDGGTATDDDADSDDGDEGGGDGGTPRATRIARASARATAFSSNLGVRRAFFPPPPTTRSSPPSDDNDGGCDLRESLFRTYASQQEAVDDLRSILGNSDGGGGGEGGGGGTSGSNPGGRRRGRPPAKGQQRKRKRKQLPDSTGDPSRAALAERLNAAIGMDLLPQLLNCGTLARMSSRPQQGAGGDVVTIPADLRVWLFRVACSGCSVGAYMSQGACKSLVELTAMQPSSSPHAGAGATTGDEGGGDVNSADEDITDDEDCLNHVLGWCHLTDGFERIFGLHRGAPGTWTAGSGGEKAEAEAEEGEGDTGTTTRKKTTPPPPPSVVDVVALKNYLDVWNAVAAAKIETGRRVASRRGIGRGGKGGGDGGGSTSPENVAGGEAHRDEAADAADALAVLVRASLDSSFHEGHGLMEPLQHLMVSLVTSVADSLEEGGRGSDDAGGDDECVTDPDTAAASNFEGEGEGDGDGDGGVKSAPHKLVTRRPPLLSSSFLDWATDAASRAVQMTSGLSSGEYGRSADDDDVDGYLPLALAVRNVPYVDDRRRPTTATTGGGGGDGGTTVTVSLPCAVVRARMAERCLRMCLRTGNGGEQEDDSSGGGSKGKGEELLGGKHPWEVRRDKVIASRRRRGDVVAGRKEDDRYGDGEPRDATATVDDAGERWRALANAEVALNAIDEAGDVVTENGPLFHAIVDVANASAEVGKAMFTREVEGSASDRRCGGVYGSRGEAGAVCRSMEAMEGRCGDLKKRARGVFVHPHLRRVKELLTWLSVHYRHCKVEASRVASQRGMQVQHSLEGWIGQDDDDDGNGDTKD